MAKLIRLVCGLSLLVLIISRPLLADAQTCIWVFKETAKLQEAEAKIDQAMLARWVDAHQGKAKELAKFVQKKLHLVGKDEFFHALDNAVSELRKKNIPSEDIVFVYLNQGGQEMYKSGPWVTGYLLSKYPELNGAKTIELGKVMGLPKSARPKHFVIVDDASYSGDQVKQLAATIASRKIKFSDVASISCLVPFASSAAKDGTERALKRYGMTADWLGATPLPTMRELLHEEGMDTPENLGMATDMWGDFALDKPLTLFFYKTPDFMSFPQQIRRGETPNGTKIPFIEDGRPPYYDVGLPR